MNDGVVEVEYQIPWEAELSRGTSHPRVNWNLPPGFDRYVRVFHPFVPWGAEFGVATQTTTWRALAREVGVDFSPTLTWRRLGPALQLSNNGSRRPWAIWEGELEPTIADALFQALGRSAGPPFFASFCLSVVVSGRPLMYRLASIDKIGGAVIAARDTSGLHVTTPEYVWSGDLSWISCTDWDLTSTYVACRDDMGDLLLADDRLETVEVQITTRIDDRADDAND